jgi:hypothetical protein
VTLTYDAGAAAYDQPGQYCLALAPGARQGVKDQVAQMLSPLQRGEKLEMRVEAWVATGRR